MGYIGKLTAQEAERLLELIEKLQQKGDVSVDGSDNCCIIDLENFSAEKYKEAYDFTQNGKFLLIKPSKESIFISTYNSEERQKDNKKYFRSELESIMNYDNGPGNRGLSVYRINITFYNDGTFEVDDSYNISFNKEGDGKKFLSNDGTYKEINASSIYAINTEEDLNYNKIKEALDNGKLISIPMMGLSICNTFIDEDNNINILMDKIPTEVSFFLNLSKATYIKISPNNEITFTSDGEEPLFNAMTINIPFVFKDIHNRTTTVVTNDTTDVNYSLDLYQNPPLIFRYEESKGHYGGYRYIIPVYQNMLNNDDQSQWVLNAKCIINTKDGLYLAEIIIDRSKNNKNITYEIRWIRPLFDTNPNTIILSFTSNGETMEDDQYALLVDSCDNNKKLKVDFLGDNIVTLDAYAIQRMVDNTITFHTHDISYTSIDHKDYRETIMTWIVKPDKSIKLLYRETSLS